MKTFFSILALLFAPFVFAQDLDAETTNFIDSLVSDLYDDPNGPGGSILVAINGKPVYRKGFGYASLELGVPNKPDMVYRIGSISKQFAAVAILMLVEEDKLSLSDPITRYLPDYDTHERTITIEHLLTHTSGIPSYTEKPDFVKNMMVDMSKKEMRDSFMKDDLLFDPGTGWSYSNSGYFLLGLIVESVTGGDFDDFLREEIFVPLEMGNTSIGTYETLTANAAYGYETAANDSYRPATYLSWTWPYAAGAIISSVDDMLKWDNALYTEKLATAELLQKAFTPFTLSNGQSAHYGYGWSISEYNGTKIVAHDGGINGFVSSGVRLPNERVYVIILTNGSIASPGAISDRIALKVASKKFPKPSPVKAKSKDLKKYEGMYQVMSSGGRLVSNMGDEKFYRAITLEDDTLRSQPSGDGKSNLLPLGKDLFYFEGSSLAIAEFKRDKSGNIKALEIRSEPIQYGPFEYEPITDEPLPQPKERITVSEEILEKYLGKYHFGSGFYLDVFIEEGELMILPTAQEAIVAIPESETKFFFEEVDATMEFVLEKDGSVKKMIYTQGTRYEVEKVE